MIRCLIVGALLLGCALIAHADNPADGFIYGTVTDRDGDEFTGFLRWDVEEAFWGDLFHSEREDLIWFEYVDYRKLNKERRRHFKENHGVIERFLNNLSGDSRYGKPSRLFICRFGDIRSMDILDDNAAEITTRDGSEFEVSGYANDVGGTILVYSDHRRPKKLDWDGIDHIEFAAAPRSAEPYSERLYGVLETRDGTFEGYIQWDESECVFDDILDGEVKRDDVEIAMGDIAVLERHNSRSCDVILKDGEEMRLRGSNDVNDDNRGIMVEIEDLGRVTVPWNRFKRLTFETGHGSGPDYDSYKPHYRLTGTVRTNNDNTYTGELAFDLDEAWSWDLFNGEQDKIDYDIPFKYIRKVSPTEDDECVVELVSGQKLTLGEGHDASENNDGALIFVDDDEEPIYVPWHDIDSIVFDKP